MTQSLFTSQTPASGENSDGTPGITVATAIRFAVDGDVTAIRFYATVTVGGTYTVGLWEVTAADPNGSGGTLLASKTMGAPPASATWNVVTLDTPVTIDTAKLYKAGVFNSQGRYVFTGSFFGSDLVSGDLTADANGDNPVGLGNLNQGSFTINGGGLTYPTNQPGSSCYFGDVVFQEAGGASTDLTGAISLPALQGSGVLASRVAAAGAVSLPALQATAVLASQAALAGALSLPALQGSGVLASTGSVDGSITLPALQATAVLASQAALSGSITLPVLDMSGVLSVPVEPAEDTSSPTPPISTVSRAVLIATISREHVITTGTWGGA
jgi:hypothetical protein